MRRQRSEDGRWRLEDGGWRLEDRGIRNLASVKKICGNVLTCDKEFAARMLFLDSYPLPPSHMGGGHVAKTFDIRLTAGEICAESYFAKCVHFMSDVKCIIFAVSMLIFFHTPCPLSLGEREGVPPHTRPFTFVNGATTPLEGSGTWQGGHSCRYIKSMSSVRPCKRYSLRSCYF